MRNLFFYLFLLGMLPLHAQPPVQPEFTQEVATHFTTMGEQPAGSVARIQTTPHLVADANGQVYKFETGNWILIPGQAAPKEPKVSSKEGEILAQTTYRGKTIVGTPKGLFYNEKGLLTRILPSDERYSWSPRQVAALVVDVHGDLWFGSQEGVGRLSDGKWSLFTGKEGLPYNQFTCASASPDGSVWFGTKRGVVIARGDTFAYRASQRWLPDDYVNDLAIDQQGTVWIATRQGISRIEFIPMSYEKKAEYFTNQVETRHNRMGFIAQSELQERYNLATSQLAISDNDGMYTAMYGAAQAFRYAVTGEAEAKELAVRSLKACKWLSDITPEAGFPARVIIPTDWREPVNEQYSRAYNAKKQLSDPQWKDIFPRFPRSKDGKYLYKCDTSSDELAGHFFFYGIYYDLVAETEAEKQEVRAVVGDIMDHLLRHGYKLVDYDGKVTRWGDFSPEYFHSVYGYDQRGLNSLMMLSFLNVTKHITGDSKYEDAAKVLRDRHNYHIFALHPKEYFPAENVVPWDNNLCLMSMYGLFKYETDPSLLLMYRQSLENAWLHMSKQKNAFWDIIYESQANRFTDLVDQKLFDRKDLFTKNHLYAPSVVRDYYRASNHNPYIAENLKKVPLDLIGYAMPNDHRLDVTLDPTPGQGPKKGWRSDGFALAIDERGHVRQDRDAFDLNLTEGDGYSEHEGTFYLLPYYMARYHHLLGK
ncbi:two component regulator with propeller domain [Dyadobacter jejuensis]|uniref:Two component regulator with propeller domain n=1 Tax=Dyadobacter jejuensis TaxID=1082580 RepID=A0A316AL24_9BACT|nr:two-component regulator propeller domain-containing protein [Dyadobacter jejuensis]PWJ58473.1 two component regulator with propeller domain [Dyadobacter jejuensis]